MTRDIGLAETTPYSWKVTGSDSSKNPHWWCQQQLEQKMEQETKQRLEKQST